MVCESTSSAELTLRDRIAIRYSVVLMTAISDPDEASRKAYRMADAFLRARRLVENELNNGG